MASVLQRHANVSCTRKVNSDGALCLYRHKIGLLLQTDFDVCSWPVVVVKTGQFLEGSSMWDSVGPIVKSMSTVMQSQLEQNRKLEGDMDPTESTCSCYQNYGNYCINYISNYFVFTIAELTGNNSTMMTMMRFVVNYSPEIAEATMNMLQNATMVTMFELSNDNPFV